MFFMDIIIYNNNFTFKININNNNYTFIGASSRHKYFSRKSIFSFQNVYLYLIRLNLKLSHKYLYLRKRPVRNVYLIIFI